MGGPTGEAYVSTLNATGLSREETLARESIQNSSDSPADETSKVAVRFRRSVLKGDTVAAFVDTLNLTALHERSSGLGLAQGNLFDPSRGSSPELPLLFVEDFGTCGLFGDPHDPNSHFYRLLLSLGDSAKSREKSGSGGSYGFGKAAYFLNSRVHTIVAHSSFENDIGDHEFRLFGCGFFQRHVVENKSYTGRAWFGIPRATTVTSNPVVDPATGASAAGLAAALGFTARPDKRTQGTSVLIVDPDLNLEQLVESIETWWWPRLLEHDIDISILDEETGKTHHPRPKRREDLKPYMDAYQIALKRVEPIRSYQKFESFNRMEEHSIGDVGLVMLTQEQESALDEERRNCVVLVREPRMVVAYYPVSSVSPSVAGCFIGHSDVEKYLKLSEPPAHNQWEPTADRLAIDGGRGSRLVKSALDRIKRKAREFQNAAVPPSPPRTNKLQRLERMLGRYFMTKDKIPHHPEVKETPIHLVFDAEPAAHPLDDGSLRMTCEFEVRLKDDAPSPYRLRLRANCFILEDDSHEGDALACKMTSEGVKVEQHPTDPTVVEFDLDRGDRAQFSIVSEPYDANWSLSFRPEVTPA